MAYQPGGGFVEDSDEGQYWPGAANDGERLTRERRVHHAANSRRRNHLIQSKFDR